MAQTRFGERVEADPIRFPRAYAGRGDVEIAAIVAALTAYGQVDVLVPFLARVFERVDAHGGPLRFAGLPVHARVGALKGLVYRWNTGEDYALLMGALGSTIADFGSVEALFAAHRGGERPLEAALDGGVAVLEQRARDEAAAAGLDFGLRAWFARPAAGSACKRWCMALRWLVRPPAEGVDLGLWRSFSPAELVLPLDVHTSRIGRWLGLTSRNDGSWRTACEITDALRALDPIDPVRFDFALAHIGISGVCQGYRVPSSCALCALDRCCAAPLRPARAR